MKKHVLGIAFFALIVVFSAIIFSVVSYYYLRTIEPVNVPLPEDSGRLCLPDSNGERIAVVQVIATPSDETLVLDFGQREITKSINATLVFFTVDGQEVKFLRSETMEIPGQVRVVRYTNAWLRDIRETDNLYVSVRRTSFDANDFDDLYFSTNGSTPVLIAKK